MVLVFALDTYTNKCYLFVVRRLNVEFTNDILINTQSKKEYNIVYSKYFYRLSKELSPDSGRVRTLERKSDRINDCLNLWLWDVYHKNRIMDLQRVNRCWDNRFCPNCKKLNLSSAIHNFSPHFKKLLDEGYNPYLLTLTIPNVSGDKLRETITIMNKAFRKFFNLFNYDLNGTTQKGFSERLIKFDAAYKVLEITCNNQTNTYHPHLHIIMFSKEYKPIHFEKVYPGPYRKKSQSYTKLSEMDIHIMQLWKMCFDGIRLSKNNFESMSTDWIDLYLCDIREMDSSGIYEVMKYTFKDTDIQNYYNFKDIFLSLENKRIRQGYGLLYNVKCEEEDGEKQLLDEFMNDKEESPDKLLTRSINELITVYKDYTKISRFNSHDEFSNLD